MAKLQFLEWCRDQVFLFQNMSVLVFDCIPETHVNLFYIITSMEDCLFEVHPWNQFVLSFIAIAFIKQKPDL